MPNLPKVSSEFSHRLSPFSLTKLHHLKTQPAVTVSQHQQNTKDQTKTARIFLIAERSKLTELITIELKQEGYQVEVFYDGISAAIAIY